VTAEWALVLMVGVGFAAVLLKIVTSPAVRSALEGMVTRALSG
jgi:hypothetical protein